MRGLCSGACEQKRQHRVGEQIMQSVVDVRIVQ